MAMREIIKLRRGDCGCCPGHDKFPDDKYGNRHSTKARARDIKLEHRVVRRIHQRELNQMLMEVGL